jgi:hypothetical protein
MRNHRRLFKAIAVALCLLLVAALLITSIVPLFYAL